MPNHWRPAGNGACPVLTSQNVVSVQRAHRVQIPDTARNTKTKTDERKNEVNHYLELPERINVSRTFAYDVNIIIKDLKQNGEKNINEDTIIEYVNNLVNEDMTSPVSRHDLVWQDENGNDL